jgi:hypothetical protein
MAAAGPAHSLEILAKTEAEVFLEALRKSYSHTPPSVSLEEFTMD